MYEELRGDGLIPLAVALDAAGGSVSAEWIQAAKPTYPCLIDERHLVADLYEMSNVPSAVWIDERGYVVRSSENCGSSDAWRFALDRETGEMPEAAMADAARRHEIYFDAVRDWARCGDESIHAYSGARGAAAPAPAPAPARSSRDEARATACFRLATHLRAIGADERAAHWLGEAASLSPRSWRIKRELWTLDDPGNLFAGEFWAEVDGLGSERYYDPPAITGMPPQATR